MVDLKTEFGQPLIHTMSSYTSTCHSVTRGYHPGFKPKMEEVSRDAAIRILLQLNDLLQLLPPVMTIQIKAKIRLHHQDKRSSMTTVLREWRINAQFLPMVR